MSSLLLLQSSELFRQFWPMTGSCWEEGTTGRGLEDSGKAHMHRLVYMDLSRRSVCSLFLRVTLGGAPSLGVEREAHLQGQDLRPVTRTAAGNSTWRTRELPSSCRTRSS